MGHPNPPLTMRGKLILSHRVVVEKRPVAHVAKELGISRQCAHRWVRRFREAGEAGLRERSSRPRSVPTRTSPAASRPSRYQLPCGAQPVVKIIKGRSASAAIRIVVLRLN